mmetsp:Transcript_46836/g.134924  ORF Transcript_46836/g.134924 Transcript_46836/m.134924 type:complete len:276 (-) Transcript_46836:1856-2683(-)
MSRSGHGRPPLLGFRMISRVRVRWPPPQVLSQSSQADHSETAQSVVLLQSSASFIPPSQGSPRPKGCCAMERMRKRIARPPSQDVHGLQGANLQSTFLVSQTWVLQTLTSSKLAVQGEPPCSEGLVISLDLLRMPPPQSTEQLAHVAQSPRTQSTDAKTFVAQACVSLTTPLHGRPPFSGAFATVRTRVRWPPGLEQIFGCHSAQSLNSQSTAWMQSLVHRSVSVNGPSQGSPPQELGCTTSRLRARNWLQEQSLQADQLLKEQLTGRHFGEHGL